ncbi:MAG: tetratricopeptide repeat protein [Planctomycetota bacterium]
MKGPTLLASLALLGVSALMFHSCTKKDDLNRLDRLLGRARLADDLDKTEEHQRLMVDLDREFAALGSASDADHRAWILRARLFSMKGQVQDALKCLQEARRLAALPEAHVTPGLEWEIPLMEGHLLQVSGKPQEALAPLRQALALRPDSSHVRLNLSEALRQSAPVEGGQEILREAFTHASKSVELKPSPATYNEKALVLLRMKDYAEARECLLKALTLSPRDPKCLYNLAITSARLSQDYAAPPSPDGKTLVESYRQEAIRTWEELRHADKKLADKLYFEDGFREFCEGAVLKR